MRSSGNSCEDAERAEKRRCCGVGLIGEAQADDARSRCTSFAQCHVALGCLQAKPVLKALISLI